MSWQHVRGHERLVETFDHVRRRGRLAHSYLFVGPQGVGKQLFAIELGKALLCEAERDESAPLEACGKCIACGLVDARTHPDFFIVGRPEEKNEMPVDVMRDLCQNFSLKSARGRGKVAVLDDADDLNPESANCFLKTLEEPPPRSVFLLIGTSPDQQLPTILSRCQVVRFAPLPNDLITDLLRSRGVEDQQLIDHLLKLSDGSPGRAIALADAELWAFRRELLAELSHRPVNPASVGKKWMQFIETAGKESAAQRRRAERTIHLLVEFLRDALAHSLGGTIRFDDERAILSDFTAGREPERLLELIDRCLDADAHNRRYLPLVLVMEGLVDALVE